LIRNTCQSYFDPDSTGQNHGAAVLATIRAAGGSNTTTRIPPPRRSKTLRKSPAISM
jgi:hypothetical protein